jgi:hypothetical protein
MSKNLYMHTIAGKPAVYTPGEQITFFNNYSRVTFSEVFVDSLEKIKSQQSASKAWRRKRGFEHGLPDEYGYTRIVDDREEDD